MSSKKAFTLIELLVVIAIIAILAAILFPVFAQAKAAAKKTAALSNTKQVATASLMYATDNDDLFPSVYDNAPGNTTPNCGGDPVCTMYPYIKNLQIWSNKYRQNGDPIFLNPDGTINRNKQDLSYNWGFEIRGAEGMVNEEKCSTGGPVQGCTGQRFNTGKSQTQLANPASLFAFGNSYDTPRQTMGAIDWFFDEYPGGQRNSNIYFGAQIVAAYADGHAKTVPWKGGISGSYWIGSPKNFQARVDGYCADPEAGINPFPRSGFPMGMGIKCKDFVAFPEAAGVTWWQD